VISVETVPVFRDQLGVRASGGERKAHPGGVLARVAIALALGAILSLTSGRQGLEAQAQQPQRVTIRVAPITQPEPGAFSARLAIQIAPREAIAAKSFLRVRGLPPTVSLTEGYFVAPGVWAVPLAALPGVTIVLPAGLQGQWDIAISLTGVDGAVLAEARTALVVAAAPAAPGGREAQPPPAVAGMVQILAPEERERALALHGKGEEQLGLGSIYAARRFFERAAGIGLAQSALALGATYDPHELAKRGVVGIQPDPQAAKKWYEKALELGAAEASDRLRRLGAQ
jgi:hypothetical protein